MSASASVTGDATWCARGDARQSAETPHAWPRAHACSGEHVGDAAAAAAGLAGVAAAAGADAAAAEAANVTGDVGTGTRAPAGVTGRSLGNNMCEKIYRNSSNISD